MCVGSLAVLGCSVGVSVKGEKEKAIKLIDDAITEAKKTTGPGVPALWLLSDDDTKVYIFGSFHVLPSGGKWKTPRITKPLTAALKVYFESKLPLSPQEIGKMQEVVTKESLLTGGTTLTKLLDADEQTIVGNAIKRLMKPATLKDMDSKKPWAVITALATKNSATMGYESKNGVEAVLAQEVIGKKGMEAAPGIFDGLETVEVGIKAISGDSMDNQVSALVFAARTLDKSLELIRTLRQEWLEGDLAGIFALTKGDVSTSYQKLIVDRNNQWVPKIEAMLDTPGTVFITVGVAHLVGPDSVIKKLKDKNLSVTLVPKE